MISTCVIRPVIISRANLPGKSPKLEEMLSEAVQLVEALPLVIIKNSSLVRIRKPCPGRLFGKGNLDIFQKLFFSEKITLVIVDCNLTAIQQRNLEREWNVKVLDRTGLILEIFGSRAMSREGVLQVELAHLNYQKSRLVRSWTHLERQRGGMGFLGGPGETQIESDKRAINARISQIKKSLDKVVKTRCLHRTARKKIPYPTIALVGYTNSGKSSVFNRLTGESTLAKNMLFATLDPKMKALKLPSGEKLILSDTVGFISDLPTLLVAAFRATLEEVTSADLILHIRDISINDFEGQGIAVESVLESLGVEKNSQRIIEVWNKIDKLKSSENVDIDSLSKNNYSKRNKVLISAKTGTGFESLLQIIEKFFSNGKKEELIFVPFDKNKSRSWLLSNNLVMREKIGVKGSEMWVSWTKSQKRKFGSQIG